MLTAFSVTLLFGNFLDLLVLSSNGQTPQLPMGSQAAGVFDRYIAKTYFTPVCLDAASKLSAAVPSAKAVFFVIYFRKQPHFAPT